ncbi:MAG: type II toxin-antitoxin system VapC family toxin [Planctomycetes bacterium]|nr:type II toxin-antitoxin system VapC family toxin [Planctomycetota bacterium]
MILLDTHVWVWWIQGDPRVASCAPILDAAPAEAVIVSAISCWEVAVLHARGKLVFDCPLDSWFDAAIRAAGVRIADVNAQIAVESTRIPDWPHRDPADRILVATARFLGCDFVTEDTKILAYRHANAIDLNELLKRGLG